MRRMTWSHLRLPRLRVDPYDVVALVGLLMICYGVWLMYKPAAYIVGGLALLRIASLGAAEGGE